MFCGGVHKLSRNSTFKVNLHAIAVASEFELMFTNTEVQKIVRISKTNQDNPNL